MANHCKNVITITSSDLETSRKLNEEFSFLLDENIDAFEAIKEKYPTEYTHWFDIAHTEIGFENNSIYILIEGDTNWSPIEEFMEVFSEKNPLAVIECMYEEPGCNIGGNIVYKDGFKILDDHYEFLEYLRIFDEERYNNELEYIFDGYTESLTLKEFKKTLTFKRYNKKEKYKFANLFKAKRKKLFKN